MAAPTKTVPYYAPGALLPGAILNPDTPVAYTPNNGATELYIVDQNVPVFNLEQAYLVFVESPTPGLKVWGMRPPTTNLLLSYQDAIDFFAQKELPATAQCSLMESLADLEHQQWALWTQYMLDNLTEENIARWRYQIQTPYWALSPKEQEKDKVWALKVLKLVSLEFGEEP